MRDRLHEVGLAQPGGAVDEQWVVSAPGGLGHGVRGGGGQLVRLADDEALEGVALVQRRVRGRSRGRDRVLTRRHEEVHLGPLLAVYLHAEHHRRRPTEDALRGARQNRGVLRFVPLDRELVRSAEDQLPLVQRDRLGRLEPSPHRRVGKFTARLFEQALPGFFR